MQGKQLSATPATHEDVLSLARRTTRLVDLGGHTVMPGFALRRGWTSINEQFVDIERLSRLRALDRKGALRLRVNTCLPVNHEDDKFGGWYLGLEPRHSPCTPTRTHATAWSTSSSRVTTSSPGCGSWA